MHARDYVVVGTEMNVAQPLPSKNLPCGREAGTLRESHDAVQSIVMLYFSDKGELGSSKNPLWDESAMGRTTEAPRTLVPEWAFQAGEMLGGKEGRRVGSGMLCMQTWEQPTITEVWMTERGTSRDGTRVLARGQGLEDGDTGQMV